MDESIMDESIFDEILCRFANIAYHTESDEPVDERIQDFLLFRDEQNRVARPFNEKFKLIRIANELYEISRIFLPQHFTLLDIKNDEHNDLIASMLKDNMNSMHEIDRMFELQAITTCLLKYILEEEEENGTPDASVDRTLLVQHMDYIRETQKTSDEIKKAAKVVEIDERSKDTKQIVEETFDCFSRYLEAYRKCAFFIAETFHVAAKKPHVHRSIQNLFESIITLEALLTSYKGITKEHKKASDKNKSSKNYSEMTKEEFCDKIDLLVTATEKAEFAYFQIKTLVYELISLED